VPHYSKAPKDAQIKINSVRDRAEGLGAEAAETVRRELATPMRRHRAPRGTGKVSRRKLAAAGLATAVVPCTPGELVLPWPPTTNSMWRNIVVGGKSRTVLSAEARNYKTRVRAIFGVALSAGAVTPMRDGPLAVELRLHPPWLGNRDIDNSIKPVLDSLNDLLWRDDGMIDKLTVELFARVEGGAVVVRATELLADLLPKGGNR
jgi:crossover junction endodeoxyribonuclease RusA